MSREMLEPREHYPRIAHLLTDEQIETWKKEQTCLCGCGEQPTLVRYDRPEMGRWGFKNGCYVKFLRLHNIPRYDKKTNTPKFQRMMRKRNIERNWVVKDPAAIVEMVERYTTKHNMTERAFMVKAGVPTNIFVSLRNNRHRSITKKSAAKILLAMGEPLNTDIARYARKMGKTVPWEKDKRKTSTAA